MRSFSFHSFVSIIGLLLISFRGALAFDNSRQDNVGHTWNLGISAWLTVIRQQLVVWVQHENAPLSYL